MFPEAAMIPVLMRHLVMKIQSKLQWLPFALKISWEKIGHGHPSSLLQEENRGKELFLRPSESEQNSQSTQFNLFSLPRLYYYSQSPFSVHTVKLKVC